MARAAEETMGHDQQVRTRYDQPCSSEYRTAQRWGIKCADIAACKQAMLASRAAPSAPPDNTTPPISGAAPGAPQCSTRHTPEAVPCHRSVCHKAGTVHASLRGRLSPAARAVRMICLGSWLLAANGVCVLPGALVGRLSDVPLLLLYLLLLLLYLLLLLLLPCWLLLRCLLLLLDGF